MKIILTTNESEKFPYRMSFYDTNEGEEDELIGIRFFQTETKMLDYLEICKKADEDIKVLVFIDKITEQQTARLKEIVD